MRIHQAIASWIDSYFDNVMTKFRWNNGTDVREPDVNLLDGWQEEFSKGIASCRNFERSILISVERKTNLPDQGFLGSWITEPFVKSISFPRTITWIAPVVKMNLRMYYETRVYLSICRIRQLAPVVRKPISAHPRLNSPNPRNKFVLRLNSVPRSSISAKG